jgi:hypothetical protein
MKFKFLHTVLLALICSASYYVGSANAALISSYDFNGDFSDTLGNGGDLMSLGGAISDGRYKFADDEGLKLINGLLDTSSYAIEIKLLKSDVLDGGYSKLIDFLDLQSESGLYLYDNYLVFYPEASEFESDETYALNTDFVVGLVRSGGVLTYFLNDVSVYNFQDTDGSGVSSSNILHFFVDDNDPGSLGEIFSGSADFIRIHDDSSTFGLAPPSTNVPEPGTFTLFIFSMMALAARRSKRQ